MAFLTNPLNFPNLTVKNIATSSDLVMISDQAAAGALKQATIGSLPLNNQQLSTVNVGIAGIFSAGLPGMFSSVQSNTITQSLNSLYNANVIFIPFFTSIAFPMGGLRFLLITALAASSITVGIYASSTSGTFANYPTGAPLITGSIVTTTSGTFEYLTASVSLAANMLYWVGFQMSSALTLSVAIAQLNIDHPNICTQVAASDLWTTNILTYSNVYSAGTLPTLTQSSIAITPCNYLPMILVSE